MNGPDLTPDGTPLIGPQKPRGAATSHSDTFVIDRLPPAEEWPEMDLSVLPIPIEPQTNCATELLDAAVNIHGFGDRTVFHTSQGTWTYNSLLERANQVANFLVTECGLEPGNRVLLHGPNTPMLAACWFGVVKAGGVCVTTMPLLKEKEIAAVCEKAQVDLALCDRATSAAVMSAKDGSSPLAQVFLFGGGENSLEQRLAHHSTEFENVPTMATDPVLIGFTSATTGTPKATVHFHRDVIAICDSFPRSTLKPTADDVFTGTPPFGFTFGLGALMLFPMRFGASVALVEGAGPDKLIDTIERSRATICFTGPTAFQAVLDRSEGRDLSSLTKCVSAGETLPKAVFDEWERRLGIRIIDGIGATEMLHIFISASGSEIRPGTTGRPIPGYQAKIVDEAGVELPPNMVGFLAVKGPTGCRYMDDSRQTDYVKFGGWNVTGDLYLRDGDGYFQFVSRADDLINSRGYKISPAEVEGGLLTHPAVSECAAIGAPDGAGSQFVKAFVVLRHPGEASPKLVEELQTHVAAHMLAWKAPKEIVFVDALPKSSAGKILRRALREHS